MPIGSACASGLSVTRPWPVLDETGSLGPFLDATIAKSKQIENAEIPDENAETPVNSPKLTRNTYDDCDDMYVDLDDALVEEINAMKDVSAIKKLVEKCVYRYNLSPDAKFATSPINIKDKAYDFSLDLAHIAIVERELFCGTKNESVVEHMNVLSDLSGIFAEDIKRRNYFVSKIFPFSLKGEAKTWYNNLSPGSITSPIGLLDTFFQKYFPASAQHDALLRIYNFNQE